VEKEEEKVRERGKGKKKKEKKKSHARSPDPCSFIGHCALLFLKIPRSADTITPPSAGKREKKKDFQGKKRGEKERKKGEEE